MPKMEAPYIWGNLATENVVHASGLEHDVKDRKKKRKEKKDTMLLTFPTGIYRYLSSFHFPSIRFLYLN